MGRGLLTLGGVNVVSMCPHLSQGRAKYESIMARVELLENSIPRLEAEFRGLEYVKVVITPCSLL